VTLPEKGRVGLFAPNLYVPSRKLSGRDIKDFRLYPSRSPRYKHLMYKKIILFLRLRYAFFAVLQPIFQITEWFFARFPHNSNGLWFDKKT
jgi:hypothetical protein